MSRKDSDGCVSHSFHHVFSTISVFSSTRVDMAMAMLTRLDGSGGSSGPVTTESPLHRPWILELRELVSEQLSLKDPKDPKDPKAEKSLCALALHH